MTCTQKFPSSMYVAAAIRQRAVRSGLIVGLAILAMVTFGVVPASAQVNETYHTNGWLLAAAHTKGAQESIWRTDAWFHLSNVGPDTRVKLYLCRSGEDNTLVVPYELELVEGQEVYYLEDVVEHVLDLAGEDWVGAIHYEAENTLVQVWARVYSTSADGTKSFGQLVEGIPTANMSPDDDPWVAKEQQWIFAMKHTSDARFRVNIGVVNPTGVASNYDIVMFGADGNSLPGGTTAVSVPPFSMVQLPDPFAAVNSGEWNNVQLRVSCSTEGGGTFAYASVVDNATNDAYFVRGVKTVSPPD